MCILDVWNTFSCSFIAEYFLCVTDSYQIMVCLCWGLVQLLTRLTYVCFTHYEKNQWEGINTLSPAIIFPQNNHYVVVVSSVKSGDPAPAPGEMNKSLLSTPVNPYFIPNHPSWLLFYYYRFRTRLMKYQMRGQLTITFNLTHPNPSLGFFSKFPSHSGGWVGLSCWYCVEGPRLLLLRLRRSWGDKMLYLRATHHTGW